MVNPIQMMIQAARGGGDPVQLISRMAGGNPLVKQGIKMVQGKNTEQLRQMAENMARERGSTAENVLRDLGLM